jgi:hypothetical protein
VKLCETPPICEKCGRFFEATYVVESPTRDGRLVEMRVGVHDDKTCQCVTVLEVLRVENKQ